MKTEPTLHLSRINVCALVIALLAFPSSPSSANITNRTYIFQAGNFRTVYGPDPAPSQTILGSVMFSTPDPTVTAFNSTTGLVASTTNIPAGSVGYNLFPGNQGRPAQLQVGDMIGGILGFATNSGKPDFVLAINDPAALSPAFVTFQYRGIANSIFASGSGSALGATINVQLGGDLSSDGKLTGITASFTPDVGLQQAATQLGFLGFNWRQSLDLIPGPSPYYARNDACVLLNPTTYSANCQPTTAPPAISDPVPGGWITGNVDNSFPFYYDISNGELQSHISSDTLSFEDRPADPCLHGGRLINSQLCKFGEALPGSFLQFTTQLVGITNQNLPSDPLFEFHWTSDFNGTAGGTAQIKGVFPIDAGSGTGGTSISDLTGRPPVPELPPAILMILGLLVLTWTQRHMSWRIVA